MESNTHSEVKTSAQNHEYDLIAWRWLLRCEMRPRHGRVACLDCYDRARDLLKAGGMWTVPDCVVGVDIVLADPLTGVLEIVEARSQVAVLAFVHALYGHRRDYDQRAMSIEYIPEQLAYGVPFVRPRAAHAARVADVRARWSLFSALEHSALWEPGQ